MNASREGLESPSSTLPSSPTPPKEGASFRESLKEFLLFTLTALVVVIPIRIFIAQPFLVNGASMEPSFEDGEYLIVDEISYRFAPPARGDVVIFKYPRDPKKYFIKRVVGLPTETVEIRRDGIYIKNAEFPKGFILEEPYLEPGITYQEQSFTLKQDEYFVMGDNRDRSSDSRLWGPLPASLLIGRAYLRLYPFQDIDIFPGSIRGAQESAVKK